MDYKHYLLSKTFWLSIILLVNEVGTALQALPLSTQQSHLISAILALALAANRVLKNFPATDSNTATTDMGSN
jgi:hypothetical protein